MTPASVAVPEAGPSRTALAASRFDGRIAAIWALAGGLVLYLALKQGGYGLAVRSQVGIVVWWLVLVGAGLGVLSGRRPTRAAWLAVGLLAAFTAWSALATTWSISTERSLQEVSRLVAYLGVLVLAVTSYGDRRDALRHTINAVAAAIVVVAVLALLSRVRPEAFPQAQRALALLGGAGGRLSYPLDYWNALAALMALGVPLLLSIAASARTLPARALAAGAVPLVGVVGYLTFSRGGAVEAAVALIVFVALAGDRLPKLATAAVCGAGITALIEACLHHSAIENGLANATAQHQGTGLLIEVVLVCALVAILQAGIALAARRAARPRRLPISPRGARALPGIAVLCVILAALALHAPTHVSHLWSDFKSAGTAVPTSQRYTSLSGDERYNYWKVAIDASSGHPFTGSGPGTFQLLWLPRAPFYSYVENAHSIYIESYAEVGLIGLAVLLAFFAAVVVALGRRVRSAAGDGARGDDVRGDDARTHAAGAAAAWAAFLVAAAIDWVWQMPVIPVAMLLLAAGALAGAPASDASPARRAARPPRAAATIGARLGAVVVSIAALVAIGVPLATASAVTRSQSAAAAGNLSGALADARTALALEPGAESARLQLALVLEQHGDLGAAVTAARRATRDEPANFQPWLVLSRLEVETGHAAAALADYRRARADNPLSPLFTT